MPACAPPRNQLFTVIAFDTYFNSSKASPSHLPTFKNRYMTDKN